MGHAGDTLPSTSKDSSQFDTLLARLAASNSVLTRAWTLTAARGDLRFRPRDSKKRHRKFFQILIPLAFSTILVTGGFIWFTADDSWSSPHNTGQPRAVLVDELSGTVPNPSFVRDVEAVLGSVGYAVDYYGPSDVTVGLFQSLPLGGYSLVIIRAHSGESAIYTSESYSKTMHVYEQLTDQVVPVNLDGSAYFAITEKFVTESLRGHFGSTLVVTMGCSGLSGTAMAQAFLEKGAKAYAGWDRAVSPRQTDESISYLVHLMAQGITVREAVELTTNHFAGNQDFQSHLGYYDLSMLPRHQAGLSLEGLAGLASIILVICAGPVAAIIIPKLLGRR
jgi:hypothetical protein